MDHEVNRELALRYLLARSGVKFDSEHEATAKKIALKSDLKRCGLTLPEIREAYTMAKTGALTDDTGQPLKTWFSIDTEHIFTVFRAYETWRNHHPEYNKGLKMVQGLAAPQIPPPERNEESAKNLKKILYNLIEKNDWKMEHLAARLWDEFRDDIPSTETPEEKKVEILDERRKITRKMAQGVNLIDRANAKRHEEKTEEMEKWTLLEISKNIDQITREAIDNIRARRVIKFVKEQIKNKRK